MVPPLEPGVAQVWWARAEEARPEHDDLLTPADRLRRSRLRRAADRRRSTVATAVVRLVLGAHAAAAPTALWIDRTCARCGGQHGRPWLPEAPGLHFSVSHSSGCVAVAVCRDGLVGIDVEEVGLYDDDELTCIAGQALAPEERAELARQPLRARAEAFTTYWTRKEALVKATGEGLATPLDQLVVSAPWAPPRVLRWAGHDDAELALHTLDPPPGLVAALAVVGAVPVRVEECCARGLLGQTSLRLPGATTRSQRCP
jgi:4'-phosphopantetheinyl transferase